MTTHDTEIAAAFDSATDTAIGTGPSLDTGPSPDREPSPDAESSRLALETDDRTDAVPRPPWRALSALLIGTFITAIDFFIVNVALPSMQAELHASEGSVEWFVAAFSLGTAAALLTAARIGDRFGRRGAFVIGIAVFVAASVVCAAAADAEVLVIGRFVQGVATAFVTTSVMAMIGSVFHGPARARAIGLYAAVLGIGAAAGQIIGGLLVGADLWGLGWRSIFAINVPIGILALVLTPFVVPATRGIARRLDVGGVVLMTAAIVALVLPLVEGRDSGWAPWVWVSFALVPVLVAVFFAQQRRLESRGGAPMFPPMLLRTPAFRWGLLWQLVFWCGQASFYVVLTMYLQLGRDLTALESGIVFLGLAVPYFVAVALVPRLVARLGRLVLVLGSVANLIGFTALAVVALTGADVAWVLVGLVFCGAAQGLSIPPSTGLVLGTADAADAGIVSGALSTMQQVGGALGVAVVGTVFFGMLGSAPGGSGVADAFASSLQPLAVVAALALVLTFLLPRGTRAAHTGGAR
ncbi:MFS transporter [Planctomonas sp. JC2975]|uniref:MFS transporter n=1 Tax=Planctomonas sp. JC2975 TaxID=2729626 RepID=UPI00147297BB|nr:MFS transporter [Planctomonas sp. JC2975]NNC12199.1 MFS transporter [Planctomonas sp. JC2975]